MSRGKKPLLSDCFSGLIGVGVLCAAFVMTGCGGNSDDPGAAAVSGTPATSSDLASTPPGPASYRVSGMVSGLASGAQFTLNDSNGDALTVSSNGAFEYNSPVPLDGDFLLTVGTQPEEQTCTLSKGTGLAADTHVSVRCAVKLGSPAL
jgi:hypothetical protein